MSVLELYEEARELLQKQQSKQLKLVAKIQEEQSLGDENVRTLVGRLLDIVKDIDRRVNLMNYVIDELKNEELSKELKEILGR